MPANPLVETSLAGFKAAIEKVNDRDAKEALIEVHDELTETYHLRVEAADHAGSFGSVEADLAAAEKAVAAADAAVFKKMYSDLSLQELFDGWKSVPVPEKIARVAKSKVRETLVAARLSAQTAYENLFDYLNKDDDPSPQLANRLGALGKSLKARLQRLDERLRSLDALE